MYESFFGLNEEPFNLTPGPPFYLSEGHQEALAGLIYGVRERAGLITLTGPVGVGKTMILASFLDQIREHAETASFSGAVSGDRVEFLKDLCSVQGITPEQDSLFGVSQAIKDFAIRKSGEGRSVVVLVDEAQDLGLEELEHFHHLWNQQTPEAKLVQLVLAGTEKLDEMLRDNSLEALWQRVAIRCAIKPIGSEEEEETTIQRRRLGAFREEERDSRRASDLVKKGSQNLFLVKGGTDKKFTFACVGVLESGWQSLAGVRQMQEWGYEDAFPLRIKEKRLEDILQPYAPSPV